MNDELKSEDIFLHQEDDIFNDIQFEKENHPAEETLIDRWKKWVDAVKG